MSSESDNKVIHYQQGNNKRRLSLFIFCSISAGILICSYIGLHPDSFWPPTSVKMTPLRTLRILCYGDSLTAGYSQSGFSFTPYSGFLTSKLLSEKKAENVTLEADAFGFSGWTTTQMAQQAEKTGLQAMGAPPGGYPGLRRALEMKAYDLVIIMAGTNDLGHGTASKDILANLKFLHSMVVERSMSLLAVGIPESGFVVSNEDAARRRSEVNMALKGEMESLQNGTYVDCPLKYSRDSPHFDYDGLHFSEEGYKYLGQTLAAHVDEILLAT